MVVVKKQPRTKKQIGVHSRNKGKRGELDVAHIFTEAGLKARRGQQFSGGNDSPDVVVPQLERIIHIEVKRVEVLKLEQAMVQASQDASPTQIPVVIHRKNSTRWVAILDLNHYILLLKKAYPEACKPQDKLMCDIL